MEAYDESGQPITAKGNETCLTITDEGEPCNNGIPGDRGTSGICTQQRQVIRVDNEIRQDFTERYCDTSFEFDKNGFLTSDAFFDHEFVIL